MYIYIYICIYSLEVQHPFLRLVCEPRFLMPQGFIKIQNQNLLDWWQRLPALIDFYQAGVAILEIARGQTGGGVDSSWGKFGLFSGAFAASFREGI